MLIYPGSGVDVFADCYMQKDKVEVAVMKAEEINGEHEVRSWGYIFILWASSFIAMITNFSQALWIKVFKQRKDSLVKILWTMGRSSNHVSSLFFDRFSQYTHACKTGAAGWRSLDIFYNYHEKIKPELKDNLEGFLARFWIGKMENRQAVTNRKKLVVDLLVKSFHRFINEPEIRLVSVASGSAQAVIEAMKHSQVPVFATLIDIDNEAIAVAKREAEEAGFGDRFNFIQGSTSVLDDLCAEIQPHIIEMVGFLDYRPKKKAIKLVNKIYKCLNPGGMLLTCNIRKNREKIFLDWILLWPMYYRSQKQFANILLSGGFAPKKTNIIYEPFKIHGVSVCQK